VTHQFTYSQFLNRFPTDDACLEEFKKLRFPDGIFCSSCKKITKHYKLKKRTAYSCIYCRSQVFPLTGTVMEKTTTPLKIWFFAIFIMTHSRAKISISQLSKELGVTYKTAWKMYRDIKFYMALNNGDLLTEIEEFKSQQKQSSIHRWTFFSKLEITVTQKEEPSE
jgi:transposase